MKVTGTGGEDEEDTLHKSHNFESAIGQSLLWYGVGTGLSYPEYKGFCYSDRLTRCVVQVDTLPSITLQRSLYTKVLEQYRMLVAHVRLLRSIPGKSCESGSVPLFRHSRYQEISSLL